ncbi:MAG: hypothetical protein ABSE73_10260 [Planctomycetota bacterium]
MNTHTKAAWAINGLLAVILVLLAGHYLDLVSAPAYAAGGGWDTDGIMATMATDQERMVLIDTKNKQICIYKTAANRFRLVGARSLEYDILVDDSADTAIEKGQGMTWFQMFQMYNAQKKAP